MKFLNLIQICLLHTVLIYTDALSIEKCKNASDCEQNLSSTKLTELKTDIASSIVQSNKIRDENQLKSQSNIELNAELKDKLENDADEIKIGFNNKSKRILVDHLNEQTNNDQHLVQTQSNLKSKIVPKTLLDSQFSSSQKQLNQISSQLSKPTIESSKNLEEKQSNLASQLSEQNKDDVSNGLKNNILNSLANGNGQIQNNNHNKKSIRTKREPRGRIGGGKASTSGTKRTKQDGTEVDDDSGSMTIKPFLSLVILSILFLFI